MVDGTPKIIKPKAKWKVKKLPPRRVQRSRSCSSLCKKNRQQPELDMDLFHQPEIVHQQQIVEDTDIDDGNELVEMLRSKFTMASPKLILPENHHTHR